jgi:hypothetical protein
MRGAALAGVATVLAATAHTIGGGEAPSVLFCAILFALATPLTTAFASARPSLWRTTAAVGSSQALFHGAFGLLGDLGLSAAGGRAAAHVHGTVSLASTADAVMTAPADMTLAHAVAALVTITVVRRGERALRVIRDWIVGAASVPAPPATHPGVPRRVAARTRILRPALIVPPGLGRRGPPLSLPTRIAA